MKLILQETVVGLGKLGDIVNVKSGYGRNYLVPYGKALAATEAHIERLGKMRAELEVKEAAKLAAANKRAEAFRNKAVTVSMHAGEEGKLYGSLAAADVVAAFAELGLELEKSEVLMPGSIREIGEHSVMLKFHPELEVQAAVIVTGSEEARLVEDSAEESAEESEPESE